MCVRVRNVTTVKDKLHREWCVFCVTQWHLIIIVIVCDHLCEWERSRARAPVVRDDWIRYGQRWSVSCLVPIGPLGFYNCIVSVGTARERDELLTCLVGTWVPLWYAFVDNRWLLVAVNKKRCLSSNPLRHKRVYVPLPFNARILIKLNYLSFLAKLILWASVLHMTHLSRKIYVLHQMRCYLFLKYAKLINCSLAVWYAEIKAIINTRYNNSKMCIKWPTNITATITIPIIHIPYIWLPVRCERS